MATVQWIDLWEGSAQPRWPGHLINGTPTFAFRLAPPGLSTRRQLRSEGLCPGRREPFGRLLWKRGRRFAWLYVAAWAKPSRTQTAAQQHAWTKAMTARRTCAVGHVADHCVRLSDRLCGDHAYLADPRSGGNDWKALAAWSTSSPETSTTLQGARRVGAVA